MLVIDNFLLIVENVNIVDKCPDQIVPRGPVGRLIVEAAVGRLVVNSH